MENGKEPKSAFHYACAILIPLFLGLVIGGIIYGK